MNSFAQNERPGEGGRPADVLAAHAAANTLVEARGSEDSSPELPQPHIGWALVWMLVFWAVQIAVSVGVAVVAMIVVVGRGETSAEQIERAMAGVAVIMIPIGTLASVVTAVVIAAVCYRRHLAERLAWRGMPVQHVCMCLLVVLPLAVVASEVTNWAGEFLPHFNAEVLGQFGASPWPLVFFAACLFPAIGEEIFCRGFLGRGLVARHGVVLGVLLASLLFGIMHIDPVQSVGAFVLGLGLHFVYLTTRSLLAPVLVHMLNNTFAFWVMRNYQWCPLPGLSPLPDDSQVHTPLSVMTAAIVTAAALLAMFYQTRTRWLLGTRGGEYREESVWSPGYVTAERPPEQVDASATASRPSWWLAAIVALSYAALIATLATESLAVMQR